MTAWVAVAAISLAIMAFVFVISAVVWLIWFARLQQNMWGRLEHLVDWIDKEAQPTVELARTVLEDTAHITAVVKGETKDFAETADKIRAGLLSVRDAAEERLQDLDTLLEVVQEEVEDTMLDVASALRTTRRGARVFKKVKRAFLGRSR
jgi:hypothetical protein